MTVTSMSPRGPAIDCYGFLPVLLAMFLGLPGQVRGALTTPPESNPAERDVLPIQRTLTLLARSDPVQPNSVRIMFYGQSITQQDWYEEVRKYIRFTYTNAVATVLNRAISGHEAYRLKQTVLQDLREWLPDLIVIQVYGEESDTDRMVECRYKREKPCNKIVV